MTPVTYPGDPMVPIDVSLRGVTKRFGGFTAVAGIDLDVRKGQFLTLLGPSGCGKTTTLRMIGGFELPDAGEILIDGEPIRSNGVARRTRMVFQNYALFPHKTVAENVAFGLRMERVAKPEIQTRVAQILAKLGLSDQAPKYPGQLSGGQQQRAALARALVTQPRVLLLDEPLGALDLKMRKHMQGELKALQRDVGITFIYVTHDQEEAMNLSDVVVVMDRGRIAQVGSPEDIYRRPATAYVADFIGETNLLPGSIIAVAGDMARVSTAIGEFDGLLTTHSPREALAPVAVAIRPECIHADPALEGGAGKHAGTVRDKAFLGSMSRLGIDVAGVTFTVDHPGSLRLDVGDRVALSWRAEDALLLPRDEPATHPGSPK